MLEASAADYIKPDSLLISTRTYQNVGEVAGLVAGSSLLPGSKAGKTSTAVFNGGLNTVGGNEAGDPSFGVTSAITLWDLNANSATANVLSSKTLDPSLVSTSFRSKSELSPNLTHTSAGYVATFMGYNRGGVGNLDVSNSDTTAYKDTTNPVTSFFAPGAPKPAPSIAMSSHSNPMGPTGFVTSLRGRARRFGDSRNCQAAATVVRHVSIATARSAWCVRAVVR
jgi:hypothetical protein